MSPRYLILQSCLNNFYYDSAPEKNTHSNNKVLVSCLSTFSGERRIFYGFRKHNDVYVRNSMPPPACDTSKKKQIFKFFL